MSRLALVVAAACLPRLEAFAPIVRSPVPLTPVLHATNADREVEPSQPPQQPGLGWVKPLAALAATAALSLAPTHLSPEFGLTPPKALAKNYAYRGKSGAIAAPSESGLGLFVDKDAKSLLRLGIIDVDAQAREVQALLELPLLRLNQVGFSGRTPIWNACGTDVAKAADTLNKNADNFVSEVESSQQAQAKQLIVDLQSQLGPLKDTTRNQNFDEFTKLQLQAAEDMSQLRELMANSAPAFYSIPDEYDALPRLRGRATVDLLVKPKSGNKYTLKVVVDGFHAPLVGGNFVDNAKKGVYDGLGIDYNEELIVQTKASTKVKAGAERTVPLELFYRADTQPSYSYTQDEDGRGADTQNLPFQAYGALGMAHPDEDNDGGSSAFFFVKYFQGLMPPGRNTLDGAYTCFGYTVDNADNLKTLAPGDVIEKATVVSGLEHLVKGPAQKN